MSCPAAPASRRGHSETGHLRVTRPQLLGLEECLAERVPVRERARLAVVLGHRVLHHDAVGRDLLGGQQTLHAYESVPAERGHGVAVQHPDVVEVRQVLAQRCGRHLVLSLDGHTLGVWLESSVTARRCPHNAPHA